MNLRRSSATVVRALAFGVRGVRGCKERASSGGEATPTALTVVAKRDVDAS